MTLEIFLAEQASDVAALAAAARDLTERVAMLEAGIWFALGVYASETVTDYSWIGTDSILHRTLAGADYRGLADEADIAERG